MRSKIGARGGLEGGSTLWTVLRPVVSHHLWAKSLEAGPSQASSLYKC